jgi:hypothetical protein
VLRGHRHGRVFSVVCESKAGMQWKKSNSECDSSRKQKKSQPKRRWFEIGGRVNSSEGRLGSEESGNSQM